MPGKPFPEREKETLAAWEKNEIFKKSVAKDAPKGPFVFFEGPPTANGRPGIHHAESRAFKDCIPRFKTMQGYRVERKAGWDTHGLPVELEVEKQLGFTSKIQIEELGIGEFNKRCRESVWTYLQDWQDFTRRLGFWVDMENPYVTYDPKYVESLWWCVKQMWDRGLLYQDYRVTPHCPRCGTSLSSHELAQGYQDIKDLAVTAEFVITEGSHEALRSGVRTSILAWTTTPWTLPGNVGLAVGPKMTYVVIEKEDEGAAGRVRFVVAKDLLKTHFPDDAYEIVAELLGEQLVGTRYQPLYDFLVGLVQGENKTKLEEKAYRVYPADFVTASDGTGIVHTAVMYGADDFELGTSVGLPKQHLVKLDGTFMEGTEFLAGRFVKDEQVAIDIIKDLAHRGLLFSKAKYEHSYPHCWRCKSPVIYYAKDSWYVRMSSLRSELLAQNETINWEPAHIKDGRFGEWLREVKDWAFSRERYWGTPLPIWICQECGDKQCIGSFEELKKNSTSSDSFGPVDSFDPHRPFVDEVELKCVKCSGTSRRVTDVCDVWFDSGAMPYAQWHYPFENKEKIDSGEAFPADYISEAIDQTRGWFYTLLAVSTALGLPAPYKNVICLGHVLDAKGKKMSKSLGNIVKPMEMIDAYGADAVRWYMYSINQPGESKRFDEKALGEMVKKVFVILDNVVSFYEMFSADVRVGSGRMDAGRVEAGRVDAGRVEAGRVEAGRVEAGRQQATPTEHVLDRWVLARLNQLVANTTDSLERYQITEPVRDIGEFINELSTWYVRRSRDRFKGEDEADKAAAIATLQTCLLTLSKLMAPFTPFLADDLYLRVGGKAESVHLDAWPVADAKRVADPVLVQMGRVRSVVSRALERRAEAGKNVRQVLASMIVMLPGGTLDAELIEVVKDEVNVHEVILKDGEYAVELDLVLTPALVREGTAREVIRRVNAMRKNAGLSIEDRIELWVSSPEAEVLKLLEEHGSEILAGTLSSGFAAEAPESVETFRANEFEITVGFTKVA